MKSFIVTSGSYSDYRIDGVFSSKSKAEDFIKEKNAIDSYADFNDVEPWEIDELAGVKPLTIWQAGCLP
jgi:hypothetical protein